MWKGDEVGNWYEFIGINWSLGSVLGNYFLSSFWNYMMQNGGFRHKPNTVNCFNCLWSDIKQELWEQFKFFAVWLKSVILWNHWWLNWSVTLADENNPVLFWDKRKLIEFIASFLKMQSVKTHVFTLTVFFFFQGRKLIGICTLMLSDISKRSPVHIRLLPHSANIIERLWVKMWHRKIKKDLDGNLYISRIFKTVLSCKQPPSIKLPLN